MKEIKFHLYIYIYIYLQILIYISTWKFKLIHITGHTFNDRINRQYSANRGENGSLHTISKNNISNPSFHANV